MFYISSVGLILIWSYKFETYFVCVVLLTIQCNGDKRSYVMKFSRRTQYVIFAFVARVDPTYSIIMFLHIQLSLDLSCT